jgi:hypothetical protein
VNLFDDQVFLMDFLQRRGWTVGQRELDPAAPDGFRRDFQDAVIALLRSRVELSPRLRCELADELERVRWSSSPKQYWRHVRARALNEKVCIVAGEMRQQGVRNPVRRAEAGVAREQGFASGKAMNRYIRRPSSHRYVDGAPSALRIFINGRDERHRVRPWDPFLTRHPATIATPIERIQSSGGLVEIQGFVLPHRDRLSDKEFESAAGHRRVDRSAGVLCLSRPTADGAWQLAWARRNARVDEGGALQTCTALDRLA